MFIKTHACTGTSVIVVCIHAHAHAYMYTCIPLDTCLCVFCVCTNGVHVALTRLYDLQWIILCCIGRHELMLGNTFIPGKDSSPPNYEVPPQVMLVLKVYLLFSAYIIAILKCWLTFCEQFSLNFTWLQHLAFFNLHIALSVLVQRYMLE